MTRKGIIATIALSAVLWFATGAVCGWHYASSRLHDLENKLKIAEAAVDTVQQVVMPTVHTERVEYIDRIKKVEVPKIVEKEVYKNVCLDTEGQAAFNTLMGHK